MSNPCLRIVQPSLPETNTTSVAQEWDMMASMLNAVRNVKWSTPVVRDEYLARLQVIVRDLEAHERKR